jgi:hypothetical protein
MQQGRNLLYQMKYLPAAVRIEFVARPAIGKRAPANMSKIDCCQVWCEILLNISSAFSVFLVHAADAATIVRKVQKYAGGHNLSARQH